MASAAGSSKKSVSWPDAHLGGYQDEIASRRTSSKSGVTTYVTKVPTVVSRAFLESSEQDQIGATADFVSSHQGNSVPIDPSVLGDAEPSAPASEISHSRRQSGYMREVLGADLGRLSYLGLSRDGDAADAEAQEAAMTQYAGLETLPRSASQALKSMAMPIETDSALERALTQSRATAAAPYEPGSPPAGGDGPPSTGGSGSS